MAEFILNNTKNASTSYILFELNYDYQPCISYEEDINPRSKWKLAKELSTKL